MSRSKKLLTVLIVISILSVGLLLLRRLFAVENSKQPIAFNHRAHVVNAKMDCSYCHEYYSKSAAAGLPPIQTCVTCHSAIASENAEIKKVLSYWERHEEIPWVRLYQMPDHVIFTHKRHIQAGVSCNVCHGNIGESTRSVREVQHTMGSCIACHKAKGASIDCWTCHK